MLFACRNASMKIGCKTLNGYGQLLLRPIPDPDDHSMDPLLRPQAIDLLVRVAQARGEIVRSALQIFVANRCCKFWAFSADEKYFLMIVQ